MRRYIYSGSLASLPTETYDTIIVGGGLAGIYTALNLPANARCLMLLKKDGQVSSSWFAQGGIAAVTLKDDNIDLHIRDPLVAGAGQCDEAAVRTLVTEGPGHIRRIIEMGVPFDYDESGSLDLGREGGHSTNRIVHSGKDATGRRLVEGLGAILHERPNVTIYENEFLTDILTNDGGVCGIVTCRHGGQFRRYRTSNLVLCTGGIGRVYRYTTNPATATGDGIAAASRAGAALGNMEFVQFHPTALALPDVHGQYFLISEAVRGDGGLLYDVNGERIMAGRHPLEDLAPRDIVAREIFKRMRETGSDKAYLDISYKGADFIKDRFPTIYETCLERGIDITRELIPVVPVQHYFMGGVKTDLNAQTSVPGLYVVGESSCTGVHGANRLASNSLLECLVFGNRCAAHIGAAGRGEPGEPDYAPESGCECDRVRINDYRERTRKVMSDDGGIIRNGKNLQSGIRRLQHIIDNLSRRQLQNLHHIEVLNMATTGIAVLQGAYARKESVGAHYREDGDND